MKLIRPSYEIIEQGPGLQGIYDIIERCGKTSYKSEPKGGEVAKKFVEDRAKEGHGAVLEFGTVYLKIPRPKNPFYDYEEWRIEADISFYKENKYSKVIISPVGRADTYYVTTNYRVLVENNRLDDLKYLCEPTEYHEKRYAVKFITDIGVGREFLRHRVMSMVQESTRYVNYNKEKFGGECTFVIPSWIPETLLAEGENIAWWDGDWVNLDKNTIILADPVDHLDVNAWLNALSACEDVYLALTNCGWKAQQARSVLPLSTKTEFVMCGFSDDWAHFFDLRALGTTGAPHPQAKELAEPLMNDFLERGYIAKEQLNKIKKRYE